MTGADPAAPGPSAARHYLTQVAAQGASRALGAVAGLVSFVLVARVLGADSLGRYSYLLAYLGIAASLAELGTTAVLARGMAAAGESAGVYFGNFLAVRGALALVVTALALLLAPWANPGIATLLVVGSLAIPFITTRFVELVFQVHGRPGLIVRCAAAYAALQLGLAVLLLAVLRAPLLAFVWGTVGAHVAYATLAAWLALRVARPRFEIRAETVRGILALSVPLGLSSLFTIVNSKADTFLITYLRSEAEVGVYNAAYRFLDLGALLALSISSPLIAIFGRQVPREPAAAARAYARVIQTAATVVAPVALALPALSPALIETLYGAGFAGAAPVLDVLVWVFGAMIFCLVSSALLLAAGEIRPAYWSAPLAVAVNIGLNLALIPRFGILGAAWATLASEIVLMGVVHAYVRLHFGAVHDRSAWVRILALNGALALALNLLRAAGPVGAVLALGGYAAGAYALRLLPRAAAARG